MATNVANHEEIALKETRVFLICLDFPAVSGEMTDSASLAPDAGID
jgi:hypothetical protein